MNLLTNALKYTPIGGRIDVSVRAEADDAILQITDTGAGIAPRSCRAFSIYSYRASERLRARKAA